MVSARHGDTTVNSAGLKRINVAATSNASNSCCQQVAYIHRTGRLLLLEGFEQMSENRRERVLAVNKLRQGLHLWEAGGQCLRFCQALAQMIFLTADSVTMHISPYASSSAHKITHFFFVGLLIARGLKTALCEVSLTSFWEIYKLYRIASSKTLLRFLCVNAEHSRYLCARTSRDTWRACSYDTGSIRFILKPSIVPRSSLRSSFVPTSIIGTFGAWCSISGYHFAFTLSNEGGLTIEKHMRKTSVWGYDNGRSRS